MKIWEKILWAAGILLLLYCIFNVSQSHAAIHWIDSTSGSDANDGSTQVLAWKSFVPFNAHSFDADDFIYLVGGRKYGAVNDTLPVAPSSGTEGHPITIMSAPGTGIATIDAAAPQGIWGAGTGWVHYADSLYYHLIAKDDSIFGVWFRNAESVRVMTDAVLDADKEWKVSTAAVGADTLKIYTIDADTSDVTRSNDQGFYSTAKSYLKLYNIKVVHGTGAIKSNAGCANIYMLTGRGNEVIQCEADSSTGNGVSFTSLQMVIAHNLMKHNGSQAHISAGADSAYIYSNTLVGEVVRAVNFLTNVNDCIFKNNYCESPVTNFVAVTTDTLNVMDYNYYYASSLTNKWKRGATSYSTLANWSAANFGQEAHSIASTTRPAFKSLTDWRPALGSALIDAGVDVARVLDFRGYPVPAGSAPDIGAYESNYGSKYIASTGSNDSTGESADKAWATLAKFSAEDLLNNLSPTDSLYLARSDTLTGQLTLYYGGTSGAHKLISVYGVGDNPVINGALRPTWTVYSDSIYQADLSTATVLGDSVLKVYIGGRLGTRVMTLLGVDAQDEWFFGADTLTVYIGGNPNTIKAEYTAYDYGITSVDATVNYVDIKSLEVIQQNSYGIYNMENDTETWTLEGVTSSYLNRITRKAGYLSLNGHIQSLSFNGKIAELKKP
jgi:hypothetical protein